MTAPTYFNEFDPFAAAWLRNLYPAATIDTRSIADVRPDDVRHFTRAHFFAGIAGWELALGLAGWPADEPVWTGSCPCQPFSDAGARRGVEDERHVWPEFLRLIAECRPPVVFGEQVASGDGRAWLAGVRADLEAVGYAVGAADLCAAGVSAPHRRQRLFWVAHAERDPSEPRRVADLARGGTAQDRAGSHAELGRRRATGPLADPDGRLAGDRGLQRGGEHGLLETDDGACPVAVADADGAELRRRGRGPDERAPQGGEGADGERQRLRADAGPGGDDADPVDYAARARLASSRCGEPEEGGSRGSVPRVGREDGNPWADALVLVCSDGKARRVPPEPEFFPLAHGVPGRVGRIRAYGNAIVPQVAAEFVKAAMPLVRTSP